MAAHILDRDLWPTVGHLVHTIATRGRLVRMDVFPTDLLVYRSAIYPQGRTFKYGLGGRQARRALTAVIPYSVYKLIHFASKLIHLVPGPKLSNLALNLIKIVVQ